MTKPAEIDPLALEDMQLKNSLQMPASVLRLQATKNTDNPFIKAELKSACQWINTMTS